MGDKGGKKNKDKSQKQKKTQQQQKDKERQDKQPKAPPSRDLGPSAISRTPDPSTGEPFSLSGFGGRFLSP